MSIPNSSELSQDVLDNLTKNLPPNIPIEQLIETLRLAASKSTANATLTTNNDDIQIIVAPEEPEDSLNEAELDRAAIGEESKSAHQKQQSTKRNRQDDEDDDVADGDSDSDEEVEIESERAIKAKKDRKLAASMTKRKPKVEMIVKTSNPDNYPTARYHIWFTSTLVCFLVTLVAWMLGSQQLVPSQTALTILVALNFVLIVLWIINQVVSLGPENRDIWIGVNNASKTPEEKLILLLKGLNASHLTYLLMFVSLIIISFTLICTLSILALKGDVFAYLGTMNSDRAGMFAMTVISGTGGVCVLMLWLLYYLRFIRHTTRRLEEYLYSQNAQKKSNAVQSIKIE